MFLWLIPKQRFRIIFRSRTYHCALDKRGRLWISDSRGKLKQVGNTVAIKSLDDAKAVAKGVIERFHW